ncbi:MAG: hypothetical protein U0350_43010 [Caldilineaceae bacterium]
MRIATFEKLVSLFQQTFQTLSINISSLALESLAVMVYKAMAAQSRNFHTLDHVFNLANVDDPIQTLAAFFHDIVYYQVDMGVAAGLQEFVAPYIRQKDGEIFICSKLNANDWLFTLALKVFGFAPGQKLSISAGLNEFLSTLVMHRALKPFMGEKELLKLTVCLEATIPFRAPNAQGFSPFDLLELRLHAINRDFRLGFGQTEIEHIVKTAVSFANKDVENFAEMDVAKFLDQTWKLLPETNVALRTPDLYSIREYRSALQRMELFLSTLNPDYIFHQYRQTPTDKEFQAMTKRARYNIGTTREYLQMKVLTVAVLEALAEVSGGDAPLSLFMGDRSAKGEKVRKLEDYLPSTESAEFIDESTVFALLDKGLISEPSFDIKHSPLSVFLYSNLGPAKIKQLLGFAKEFFDGRMKAHVFLTQIEPKVIAVIAQASAFMVSTRREKLLEYCKSPNLFTRQKVRTKQPA